PAELELDLIEIAIAGQRVGGVAEEAAMPLRAFLNARVHDSGRLPVLGVESARADAHVGDRARTHRLSSSRLSGDEIAHRNAVDEIQHLVRPAPTQMEAMAIADPSGLPLHQVLESGIEDEAVSLRRASRPHRTSGRDVESGARAFRRRLR